MTTTVATTPTNGTLSGTAPNLTYTPNPDFSGPDSFTFLVNDGAADSEIASVAVITVNTPPVANAGPDQYVPVLSDVTLDGSGSYDLDGDPLTYTWSMVTKPAVVSRSRISAGAGVCRKRTRNWP